MKRIISPFRSYIIISLFLMLSLSALQPAHAQSDLPRQTVAITYPLEQTVTVRFRGTTRFPRLRGEAKIRRNGRRGTRVELSIENMPRALELGGVYTTYVLWAISPEGRVDNLGEIKRSGSVVVDSKIDVTTPLQTFALIVTAEPHFLVSGPSRMVVLENLPPAVTGDAQVSTMNVQYLGNTSDYFKDPGVPEVADANYLKTPISLLGARQAVNLARYAGAESDATEELRLAENLLDEAERAWRVKQPEAEIDVIARRATSAGVKAEEMAGTRKAARLRRDEIQRRDQAVREAENNAATATQQIEELKAELDRERHGRELAERDAANATRQLSDLRTEVAQLRDELQSVRSEGEDAKLKLARIEGERSAEQARIQTTQRAEQLRANFATLKQSLARFGKVNETTRGLVLVLPETLWTDARSSNLSAASLAKLDPLMALLANNPDYKIVIESFTDNKGDEASLQSLTQERAQALADRFVSAGIDGARIQATGMGTANPIASNARPNTRTRNRRTEITLVAAVAESTAGNQ
ncbi:MAG TPA: OmpA family protein [Pyrinomonadaceae bacterium]|jgi:outer membrane protein OmpA-like peptidoglycan-associated protein